MSYSPSTMSDDNKPPPDPRYHEWDARSRKELQERLYEAVDKRREATEELIPRVISEQLHILGVNNITSEQCKVYNVSQDNVIKKTHVAIEQQIHDWKGLRWWRFNEKNACDTWNKWFKKAKCWQDQNQHKPLGRFWCLIFDELRQYTLNVAKSKFPNEERHKQALQNCLFAKCVEAILKGAVRFERTRETPLLPVRALTQSKELQQKLHQIDNGFVLSQWKQQAEADHKRQKQQYRNNRNNNNNNNPNDKGQRANVATILNERCGKHATNVYRRTVRSLQQIIPTLNIDMAAIESATQLNHNPYSTNSDYQTVSSINHNSNNDNNRSRYQYIANDHINDERQRRRRTATTTTTPAVFASLPSNMDVNANRNSIRGYGATRGMSDNLPRAESHRYSPTLSSNCLSDTSSISDAGSSLSVGNSDTGNISNNHSNLNNIKNNGRPGYLGIHNNNNNHRRNALPTKPPAPRTRTIDGNDDGTRSQLDRLSMENQELRSQLALIRRQLEAKSSTSSLEQQSTLNAIVQQMQMQNQMNQFMMAQNMKFLTPPHIPSPMTVGIPPHIPTHPSIHQSIPPQLPPSIPFNDRRGGHGIYNPPNVDMDQVINNNTMNMDIAMSSASLSDDSSITNDNHKKKKHCNNNDKNNNNNNKNKNNPTTVQPGIYYNSPHCFCSPPSDIIYHHQQEGCPPPETDNRSSPIPPSFSSCTQTSGVSAVSAPSTVYDIDDNDTQFPFNPYNSTIDGSVPPPPPNYNKYPFERENFDNFSVYGQHPAF